METSSSAVTERLHDDPCLSDLKFASNSELGEYEGSVGSCFQVICVSFSLVPEFSLGCVRKRM